jgi:phosphopantothenoylcysteine decarboxylase/phosphopantothenate--cysteine ligase
MNTSMLHHPATQRNLQRLKQDGVTIIEPDEGEMACGTVGPGRLSEPDKIVAAALALLRQKRRDLANERFLITVGATREEIDPVRFISNRSSGRMGFAVAKAAAERGAAVTLVSGATTVDPPQGVRVIKAISAADMHKAVMKEIEGTTVFVGAAAVADYRPAKRSSEKIKKTQSSLMLELERNPDILAEVAALHREGLLVIGFAAETDSVLKHAQQKLLTKNLDAIVANDVSRRDAGFDSEMNSVTILLRDHREPKRLDLMPKNQVAEHLLDAIIQLRNQPDRTTANQKLVSDELTKVGSF